MGKTVITYCLITLATLSLFSAIAEAADRNALAPLEPAVDFDFVTLAKGSSPSVTADISFPLDFQIIPILVIGEGTGAISASISRTNTTGEVIYIFQRFPGAHVSAFNFGITPVTIRTSTEVTLGPGWALGYVITGILISPETPPYSYTVSLGF